MGTTLAAFDNLGATAGTVKPVVATHQRQPVYARKSTPGRRLAGMVEQSGFLASVGRWRPDGGTRAGRDADLANAGYERPRLSGGAGGAARQVAGLDRAGR